MKDVDISLSEKVAEQASQEINDLKKTIDSNKDAHISLLQDVLGDMRDQRKFLKKISMCLCLMIMFLILGMTILGVYNQTVLKSLAKHNVEQFIEFFEKMHCQNGDIISIEE